MFSTACPECRQVQEKLGQRDGSCNPGCPNTFRAEQALTPLLPPARLRRRHIQAPPLAPIDFLND